MRSICSGLLSAGYESHRKDRGKMSILNDCRVRNMNKHDQILHFEVKNTGYLDTMEPVILGSK